MIDQADENLINQAMKADDITLGEVARFYTGYGSLLEKVYIDDPGAKPEMSVPTVIRRLVGTGEPDTREQNLILAIAKAAARKLENFQKLKQMQQEASDRREAAAEHVRYLASLPRQRPIGVPQVEDWAAVNSYVEFTAAASRTFHPEKARIVGRLQAVVTDTRTGFDGIGRAQLPSGTIFDFFWADGVIREHSKAGSLRECERVLSVAYEIVEAELSRLTTYEPRSQATPAIFGKIANDK